MAYIEKFNWFCGKDNETLTSFEWDVNDTMHNACFADLVYTAPHALFIVLGSLILLVVGCCTSMRKKHPSYLIPFPGHKALWVLYIPFLFGLMCSVGEGAITDLEVYKNVATQPRLYLTGVCSMVGGMIALMYYHHMEVWNKLSMAWLLLIYWATALAAEGVRFVNLYDHDADSINIELMRVDINILMLVTYSLFTLITLYLIVCKVMWK